MVIYFVGKVYADIYGSVVVYAGNNRGYGWTSGGSWYYNDNWGFERKQNWKRIDNSCLLELYEREAEKRGFVFQKLFNALPDNRNGHGNGKVGSSFDIKGGVFYTVGYGRHCISKDGEWASVGGLENSNPIKKITKEKLASDMKNITI